MPTDFWIVTIHDAAEPGCDEETIVTQVEHLPLALPDVFQHPEFIRLTLIVATMELTIRKEHFA